MTAALTDREKALIRMTVEGMREEFAQMLENMAADPHAEQVMTVRQALGTAARVARKLELLNRPDVGGRA